MIGWSVVELATLAADGALPKQTAALKKVCELLAAQQGKLTGYAQEVKQERISRSEVKSKLCNRSHLERPSVEAQNLSK